MFSERIEFLCVVFRIVLIELLTALLTFSFLVRLSIDSLLHYSQSSFDEIVALLYIGLSYTDRDSIKLRRYAAMAFKIIVEVLFRAFQFVSYVIATYTFARYYFLPAFKLGMSFLHSRHPPTIGVENHRRWFGNTTPRLGSLP